MKEIDIWSNEAVEEMPNIKGKEKLKTKEKKETLQKNEEQSTSRKTHEKIEKKDSKTITKESEKLSSGIESGEVIYFPLISEKAVGMIESQNKITFIVNKKASKQDIKEAIEKLYGVKVDSVNTLRDMHGRKKAIVKLNKSFKAQELATKLGVI